MALTFRGGIHVEEHKNTAKCQVQRMPPPARVCIPLSQHIGAPCAPMVKPGDRVLRGQVIGTVEKGLGCPVHASVSGTVAAIEERGAANGSRLRTVVIDNDGTDELDPSIHPVGRKLSEVSTEEIIEIVRQAGISGMGGATFPTYAKIQSAMGKVEHLIINCAECEPYITANHRLLLESPASVINGLKILLKALGLRHGIIAVEDNKQDAADKLNSLLGGSELITVAMLKTKYPQGDERQLIYALTGRELPAGKLPADVGCVIFNAETCSAVFAAFSRGMPLIERIVTVDGDCIAEPGNVLAPIGASYLELINFCGGLVKTPKKIISGGPMMGIAQWDITSPVVKGTSAILALSGEDDVRHPLPAACIRCGKCVANCPMRLMPAYLAMFARAGQLDMCDKYDAMSCVECGSCSYNCPGGVPIVQYIRVAKGKLGDAKRAAAAKAKAEAETAAKAEETAKTDAEEKAKAEAQMEPEKTATAATEIPAADAKPSGAPTAANGEPDAGVKPDAQG